MAGTIRSDTIQSELGTPTVFRNVNGAEIGRLCRASFCYTGVTPAVYASFNISSVTKNATGTYTPNFSVSMSDAYYIVSGSYTTQGVNTNAYIYPYVSTFSTATLTTPTASSFIFSQSNQGFTVGIDSYYTLISIDR